MSGGPDEGFKTRFGGDAVTGGVRMVDIGKEFLPRRARPRLRHLRGGNLGEENVFFPGEPADGLSLDDVVLL